MGHRGWKNKVKDTKPNSIKPFGIQALYSRDKEADSGKGEERKQNARQRAGLFCMVCLQQVYTEQGPCEVPAREDVHTCMSCRWPCLSYWEQSPSTRHGRSNNTRAQDEKGARASELNCTQACGGGLESQTSREHWCGDASVCQDKASPGNCAETIAHYARNSRSQN